MTPKDKNGFPKKVVDTIAKRAGQRCSNPNCKTPTSGGNSDPTKATIIGEAAHVRGAQQKYGCGLQFPHASQAVGLLLP